MKRPDKTEHRTDLRQELREGKVLLADILVAADDVVRIVLREAFAREQVIKVIDKGRAVGLRQAARQLGEVPCIESTHIAEERIHTAALHEAIIEAPRRG